MASSYIDPEHGVAFINETELETEAILDSFKSDPVLASLVTWTNTTQGLGNPYARQGTLFDRDRYVTPTNPYDQMRTSYDAAESDDVVSSIIESTEALAFSRMGIECEDEDEEDIWNQISEDIDLDNRMREIWRERFITSNCYLSVWWGSKNYKVSGKSEKGVKRKKEFNSLRVPLGISLLDPLKILPVGGFMFNQERLCYIADWTEKDVIDSYLLGDDTSGTDPIIQQLIVGKYIPDIRDRKQIGNLGVDPNRLYLLNPLYCFRITDTRAQYQRFASVRLKSIFQVLDLKHQLQAMDRAHLLGATNFIVLVRKGTDVHPAQQAEVTNLQAQVRTLAQVPVLVGDHRLDVQIVTPKTDTTLSSDKYLSLNQQISARMYGFFLPPHGGRGDDSTKIARVVARGLETKRDVQRRAIQRYILEPTFLKNDALQATPSLKFYPRRVALDFDPALASYILDLYSLGAISRDSVLTEIDFDEADEARRRTIEKDKFDKIFMPPVLPPGSPGVAPGAPGTATPKGGGAATKSAGRQGGGSRSGGGAAPGSGQGQGPRNPRRKSSTSGTNKPQQAADDELTESDVADDEPMVEE